MTPDMVEAIADKLLEDHMALMAENARLREELAAAQVDAKRYRWLRDTQEGKTVRIMYRREWDKAIDEAIRKEKQNDSR